MENKKHPLLQIQDAINLLQQSLNTLAASNFTAPVLNKKTMHSEYCTFKEVQEITGLKRPTLYKWIKEGSFPKQIAIGKRMIRFRRSEVMNWIDDRKIKE